VACPACLVSSWRTLKSAMSATTNVVFMGDPEEWDEDKDEEWDDEVSVRLSLCRLHTEVNRLMSQLKTFIKLS
jgi:hypothetical protein